MKLHQYNYIAEPGTNSEVLDWFASLGRPQSEITTALGSILYFPEFGELMRDASGAIIGERSPVVLLNVPRVQRGILWTVGEVKFLADPISKFPGFHMIERNFKKWLSSRPLIFSHSGPHDFDYYLEGGSRNFSREIYAFDSGLQAIQGGRYFVSHLLKDAGMSALCRELRLRGIECAEA